MPCSSHFAAWLLAMAALCAAVGFGCSTGSLPIFEGLLDEEDEFELLDFLNFSLRLQAATTNTIATTRETFFIRSPNSVQIRKANAFYRNRAQVSNEFARLQFRARRSVLICGTSVMQSVPGAVATGLLSWQNRLWRGLRPRYRPHPQIKTLPGPGKSFSRIQTRG